MDTCALHPPPANSSKPLTKGILKAQPAPPRLRFTSGEPLAENPELLSWTSGRLSPYRTPRRQRQFRLLPSDPALGLWPEAPPRASAGPLLAPLCLGQLQRGDRTGCEGLPRGCVPRPIRVPGPPATVLSFQEDRLGQLAGPPSPHRVSTALKAQLFILVSGPQLPDNFQKSR